MNFNEARYLIKNDILNVFLNTPTPPVVGRNPKGCVLHKYHPPPTPTLTPKEKFIGS